MASLFVMAAPLYSANLYWVSAAASNWELSANWASASGGPGGAGIPSANDVAIFDGNGNGACTIDADASVRGIKLNSTFNSSVALHNGPNFYIGDLGFTQSHGTFDGETGYVEVLGKFSLRGGTFLAPQSDLYITGTRTSSDTIFSFTNGNFVHQNANVSFSPESGCSALTFFIVVPPSNDFYNVTFEAANTCNSNINSELIVAGSDTLSVSHELHINDGMLGGAISCAGNLFLLSGSTGGYANVILKGPGTQYYSSPNSNPRMDHLVIDKISGSVLPALNTHKFSVGSFSLLSGTFLAPQDTFFIGGIHSQSCALFTHTVGIFDHNNAAVVLDPQSGSTGLNFTMSLSGSNTPFNNIIVRNIQSPANSSVLISAGDTLFNEGNLLLEEGMVNGSVMQTEGDVTIGAGYAGGNAKLLFSGKNPQSLDASANTSGYKGTIVINKLLDVVTLSSPLFISSPGQQVEFVKGNIISSSVNLLTFGDNTSCTGANDSSFVNGPVSKKGDDAFEFPVGTNGTVFAPLKIDASNDVTNEFIVSYSENDPSPVYPSWSLGAGVYSISSCEYWNVTHVQGTTGVRAWLSWNSSRSCTSSASAQIIVAQWDGTMWQNKGALAVTGNTTTGFVQSSSLVNNGVVTLGSSAPLGVNAASENFSVAIFPVPASDVLHIRCMQDDAYACVYDVNGNKIFEELLNPGTTEIPVSSFAKGNYFLLVSFPHATSTGSNPVMKKVFVVE
ncbi:MAG: T9SS type A sorting domain-containing protein [Bacteroidetes bacterium]|nr:T9SS type A sorting domain-containing protein [Bacteroidota bacterium]